MRLAGKLDHVLNLTEIDLLHHSALRILDEMGVEIQNEALLQAAAAIGGRVDFSRQRVFFSPKLVEDYIASVGHVDWEDIHGKARGIVGIYHSQYLDPASGELTAWSEESLAGYFSLARQMKHIDGIHMLGCRLPAPPHLEPLYERYYCWKYGIEVGGSIHLDELCSYLYELHQARADLTGLPLSDVWHGSVYLLPPLKLGVHEAFQLQYFRERGLRVGIGGSMGTMGATVPVTYAGAVALNLAEQLAINLLRYAFYGDRRLSLGVGVSVMDLRTAVRRVGRPGIAIVNVMMAQLARYYRIGFHGHGGLTDAKMPSVEVGAQKALSSIPILLAGGQVEVYAGLLSMDEIVSPVQLILDDEFVGALDHFAQDFEITPEAIDLNTILEAGPGGQFLDKPHTARYARKEQWISSLWSHQMLKSWLQDGSRIDVDLAREKALALGRNRPDWPGIPEIMEKRFREICLEAERAFISS